MICDKQTVRPEANLTKTIFNDTKNSYYRNIFYKELAQVQCNCL